MATFYADEIQGTTDLLEATNLGDRIDGAIITPRLSIVVLTYTMDGDEAAADKIRLFRGKQGMMIFPTLSSVYSTAIATTATLDIGDLDALGVGAAADEDRYADGLDVAAAGLDVFSGTGTPAAVATPYRLGSDAWIECLFKTLVTPVAAKRLEFVITYGGA
jgi:hypothetical protein